MSCRQCRGIRGLFGDRVALRDRARYRRRGPARTTRLLVEALKAEGVSGGSLLDIGGGVGAVPQALLAAGASSAVAVDASPAYLAVAREEAERLGTLQRMTFLEGDATVLAPTLAPADIVTLDRVLCCYPDLPALVSSSAALCRGLYGLVYPHDAWWTRTGVWIVNLVLRLTVRDFQAYVHPSAEVNRLLSERGFERRYQVRCGMWQVVLFRRMQARG